MRRNNATCSRSSTGNTNARPTPGLKEALDILPETLLEHIASYVEVQKGFSLAFELKKTLVKEAKESPGVQRMITSEFYRHQNEIEKSQEKTAIKRKREDKPIYPETPRPQRNRAEIHEDDDAAEKVGVALFR